MRSQLFMLGLFLLCFLSVSLYLVLFSSVWTIERKQVESRRLEIREKVREIINRLVNSRGWPENWNTRRVQEIGLYWIKGISKSKVLAFKELCTANYERTKELLGLPKDLNFFFKLLDVNGEEIASCGSHEGNEVFVERRLVLLQPGDVNSIFVFGVIS